MRKLFLTLIVTVLLPTFAFGQDDASSENETQEEKEPKVIIMDPELDPYGPLFETEKKTLKIGHDDEDNVPDPNVLEP